MNKCDNCPETPDSGACGERQMKHQCPYSPRPTEQEMERIREAGLKAIYNQ